MDATTATAIDAWIDWAQNRRGMRPSTVYSYRDTYVRMADMIGKPIDEISLGDLEQFQRRPRGKGVVTPAPATLKREAAELRHLFSWCFARKLVTEDPSLLLEAPTVHNENPKALPDSTWIKLWRAAESDEERVMLGLGYFLGFRSCEIAWVQTAQFVWEPRPMVVALERKGGYKQNIPWTSWLALIAEWKPELIPEPRRLIDPLQRLLVTPGPLLSRWSQTGVVTPTRVGKWFQRVSNRAGVDAHIHQLRHSFVTNQLRTQRVPIEEVSRNAGHRDISTTMRYVKTETDYIGSRIDTTAILGWEPRAVPKWGPNG